MVNQSMHYNEITTQSIIKNALAFTELYLYVKNNPFWTRFNLYVSRHIFIHFTGLLHKYKQVQEAACGIFLFQTFKLQFETSSKL